MADKDFYKSVNKANKALDKYISRRARLQTPETVIVWHRVIPAFFAMIGVIAASAIWWKIALPILSLLIIVLALYWLIDYLGWSRKPRHRLRDNGPVPTSRITDTGGLLSIKTSDLRKIFKVGPDGEVQVRMKDLKKGDKFRIETDDPTDHLFGKKTVVYTAATDGTTDAQGRGSVALEVEEERHG
jgi:hypothetical protein